MKHNKSKFILRWVGRIITIFSIAFVLIKLSTYSQQLNIQDIPSYSYLVFIFCIGLYAFGNYILSMAWRLLVANSEYTLSASTAIWMFGGSQIAKYLPGNIFQFASRQVIGVQHGIKNNVLLKSTLWEIGLMGIAAGSFGVFLLNEYFPNLMEYEMTLFAGLIVITGSILSLIASRNYLKACGLYLCFFLVSGGIFSLIFFTLNDNLTPTLETFSQTSCYFIIAWLIGFATPGSPAGLGVREAVLITLLDSPSIEDTLLVAVLISRIVTVLGDMLFFAISSLFRPKQAVSNNSLL